MKYPLTIVLSEEREEDLDDHERDYWTDTTVKPEANVKLSLRLTKHHALETYPVLKYQTMKTYGEWRYSSTHS
jgi:hypothetical protein